MERIRRRARPRRRRARGAARLPPGRERPRGRRRRRSSRASASAPPSTARPCAASRPAGSRTPCATACREHGARRLAVPPGAPHHLPGLELLIDDPPISARGLDQVDGVLTGCALAIAETGTIVLDGGERSGRRALTLVPDFHVCLVEAGAHPRVGPGRDRRARARRRRGPAAHVRLRPERDVGHRARARRGRPRPAHARDPGAGGLSRCDARPPPSILALVAALVAAATGRGRRARRHRARVRRRAPGLGSRVPLDRAGDDHAHEPRRRAAGPGLDPAVGQRTRRLPRRRAVRIADVAGAVAGAPAVACTAVPLRLAAPLAPGARGSVAFDVEIRVPAVHDRFGHGRRVALLSNAIPALAHLEGGSVAARPVLRERGDVDLPGRRVDGAARRAARASRSPRRACCSPTAAAGSSAGATTPSPRDGCARSATRSTASP